MASSIDICNLALSHLGQNPNIATIDPPDTSEHSQVMARFYPMARDTLLERNAWSFAVKRAALNQLTNNDRDTWDYAYQLPSDFLRPLALLPDGATDDDQHYEFTIEGTTLYTNLDDAQLRYIAKVTDTTKWSPLFVHALSWLLASFAAGSIIRGQDPRALTYLYDMANRAAAEAMSADGKRKKHNPKHSPSWIRARGGIDSQDDSYPVSGR